MLLAHSGFAQEPFSPPVLRTRSPSQFDSGVPQPTWRRVPSRSRSGTPLGEADSQPPVPHSSVALCKLLQHGITADDRRLQDIRVKGEELHSPDEGVRTRSKSAKSAWRHRPPPLG